MAVEKDDLLLEDDIAATFFDEEADANETSKDDVDLLDDEGLGEGAEEEDELPGQLAVDIYETADKLIVKSRVAGVSPKDLQVSVNSEGLLEIQGTLSAGEDAEATQWHLQECYWGEFKRSIELPVAVDDEVVDAVLKQGVLTVSFTKLKGPVKKIGVRTEK